MRRILLFALLVGACASPPPYQCTTPVDLGGRGIALCAHATETPVCDAQDGTAHYETNSLGGYTLTDGSPADCDSSNQVVCADRTMSPHCITQPTEP